MFFTTVSSGFVGQDLYSCFQDLLRIVFGFRVSVRGRAVSSAVRLFLCWNSLGRSIYLSLILRFRTSWALIASVGILMWLGDAAQLHFYCSRMLFLVSIILIFIFDWLVRHSVFSVPYFTSGISLLG